MKKVIFSLIALMTAMVMNGQVKQTYLTLNNGVQMPQFGLGVYSIPDGDETYNSVLTALKCGYRHIDTAQAYYNEEGVGAAIAKSGVKREDIFLVTKVWISNAGEEKAAQSIDESLCKLQTDYIDLLLIHQAYGDVFGSWRAMEKACKAGKVRAIGVSNFQAARLFDFAHYVDVKPMVNQLKCNPMIQQTSIEPLLTETGTKMMAWGPLGGQGTSGIVKSELLADIGSKYGKSAAQVALRWLTQRGIVAIPKSSHKERMAQNLNIFDFMQTTEEMAQIATMNQHDTGTVNFQDPQFVKYLIETYG
jgi:diketogulonate reductase-like aldo/keto reductase